MEGLSHICSMTSLTLNHARVTIVYSRINEHFSGDISFATELSGTGTIYFPLSHAIYVSHTYSPRIQAPNIRTPRLPIKHKLTHNLPRSRSILDSPTSMSRRKIDALRLREADQRPTTSTDLR